VSTAACAALGGCSRHFAPPSTGSSAAPSAGLTFLHPHGPIAAMQRGHLIEVVALLMVVVLPVLILTPLCAWRFRYTSWWATYRPRWSFSWPLEILVWGVPFAIVILLAIWLWKDSEALDPYAPIVSQAAPLRVQVVSYDWKWLFIYPDLKIASMGELAFPADRPLALQLTSDTVMQSFFIPSLGSQIYTMAGMVTRLHLEASAPGAFRGENTQYNGEGFYQQKFTAEAMTPQDFKAWTDRVAAQGVPLSATVYRAIARRSTVDDTDKGLGISGMPNGVLYLSHVPPDLFHSIVHSFHGGPDVPAIVASQSGPGTARTARAPSTVGTLAFIFGRLDFDSLPFSDAVKDPTFGNIVNDAIATFAASIVLFGGTLTAGLITYYGKWRVLWSEWLTSVDHKRIGIMYIVLALVMLARALIEAALMRGQQAFGLGGGFLSPEHFGQLFSTHGSIMIFFMAMPFLTGMINYVMPLQIGARDVSFPVMNSVSLGLTTAGAVLVMISLVVLGKFSTGGWSGYPPYTETAFSPHSPVW
jgi:cytochrome o ubiquinol oxidase subunit II